MITPDLGPYRVRDTAGALSAFHPDAAVTDDGKACRGAAAIETWLTRTAGKYTYTIERTEAWKVAPERYVAAHHPEGDFPGGVVDCTIASRSGTAASRPSPSRPHVACPCDVSLNRAGQTRNAAGS
ncbi:hypothetical protein ABT215_07725 [Streptomyces sp900105755]|uniref:hypothetical protein n=1 Tax=Streptomyces sp. 900105755 TaxID=3154389 RepID=UPI00331955AD